MASGFRFQVMGDKGYAYIMYRNCSLWPGSHTDDVGFGIRAMGPQNGP